MTILTPKGYTPRQPSSEKPPAQPEPQPQPQPQAEPQPQDRQQRIKLRFPPQVIGINCPNCGTPYPAQVFNIVDVGQDPVLKSVLLSGQLNVAVCPRCGAGGAIGTPMLYHDPEHSFLGVYVPQQVPVNEQQRTIGDLSRRLMDGLPQEARRGYMLTPKQFLTYQGMLEAILENEGVTREMLDKQRRQIQLVEQSLTTLRDPEGLRLLVKERDAEMDDEFFGLLNSLTESTAASGDGEAARELLDLRERLIELTTWGKGVQKQRAALGRLRPETTPQELAEMVIAEEDQRVVDALVLGARPLVNYAFYQALAERIETAERRGNDAEATRLNELREHILKFSEQVDQLQRAAMQQYSQVLGDILAANDVEQAVAERAQFIDQNFLSVLAANMQEAERRNATAALRRLQEVWDASMALVEQDSPPEVQLINDLLAAEYPGETRKILSEHRDLVTAEFVEAVGALAEQLDAEGSQDLGSKLRQIRSQAQLMR